MRFLGLLLLLTIIAGCQRPICNTAGQPADSNPRNGAGELDSACPAYGVVSTVEPQCAEPGKRCVYRAMGDCVGDSPGAACQVCSDVICDCSCRQVLDGGAGDAGCVWLCGR